MMKWKVILIISLALNLALVGGVSIVVYKKGGVNFIKQQVSSMTSVEEYSPYYRQKVSIYESAGAKNVDAVMIGDSITDHGEWSELFTTSFVINRGISDDDTNGVLNRLDEIVEKQPKKVFIMIGINDFLHGMNKEETIENYKRILDKLNTSLPSSKVYIQSILPVNNDIYGNSIDNDSVNSLNGELEVLAKESNVSFIDLYSALSTNNQLEEKYTIDGIHLTGQGYAVWKNEIGEFIK